MSQTPLEPDVRPLLVAEGLRKSYGDIHALKHLDLQVNAGEVVGLLGPNGAGKTTSLRCLAAILTPSAGRASICGYDTRKAARQAKRNLGFLSGDTALYQRLTPREVMRFFGRLHEMQEADIEARADVLIEQLDMKDFADRQCGTLSSGQTQRANIARTLVHDPPVLILDEPTTALDIISGRFILESIRKARGDGKAVLFSTHIMEEAEYLCDRVVLIHQGEVRAAGTMAQLRERSGHQALTQIFLDLLGETV